MIPDQSAPPGFPLSGPIGSGPAMPGMGAGSPVIGGEPPIMGLFGMLSKLAEKKRIETPMDNMKRVISLLNDIRESDPEKTGRYVPMAIDILRNGPGSDVRDESGGKTY